MHKWIVGSTCAAAVLSAAIVSAQTYPQTSDDQKKSPSTSSGSRDTSQQTGTERATPSPRSTNAAQRVTMTGCLMQGTDARNSGWILSNASPAAAGASSSTTTSRSGSPSNEGSTAAGNRNGATGAGVSGSTSTGTSGAGSGTSRDTEADGAGVTGTTDRRGSTVGAGATTAATGNTADSPSSSGQGGAATRGQNPSGSSSASASSSGTTYRLEGVKNPAQYKNKRVEVIGTTAEAGNSGNQMLRVTSVRTIEGNCP